MSATRAPTIHGAYDWEVTTLPRELPDVEDRSPDMSQYDTWAGTKATNGTDRTILSNVKSNLQHVSYDTFSGSVGTCVAEFGKTAPSHYVAFVEPGKSQTWVTSIAMEYGLRPDLLLRIGEEGANMLPTSLDMLGPENFPPTTKDIVIVDNGAFTGNQMANNITSANSILTKTFGFSRDPYHFHVIVPYTTAKADQKILSAGKTGAKVHLYSLSRKMPVVSDVIHPRDQARASKLLGFMPERVDSTALTFFDHKIPNSMSFPSGLERAGFIPNQEPPYKQPPFVVPEMD